MGLNTSLEQNEMLVAIKCIGQGLYNFEDGGTFTNWLKEHPYSVEKVINALVNFS